MLTDATPTRANDIYSHPTKRAWQRKEHVYMEIGPPSLPNRGYKNDWSREETQCQNQHGDIHPAKNLAVLWI